MLESEYVRGNYVVTSLRDSKNSNWPQTGMVPLSLTERAPVTGQHVM